MIYKERSKTSGAAEANISLHLSPCLVQSHIVMDVFSENPRSFKMDRKSPFAAKLKAFVAEKLVEFLENYTDDILAEYIMVLVCHGKNQNQARDDLEAFLGGRSSEFVLWLWDLILKNSHESNISMSESYPQDATVLRVDDDDDDDVDKKQRSRRLMDLQNHDTGNAHNPQMRDRKCDSTSVHSHNPVCSNRPDISKGIQHRQQADFTDELNLEAYARACRSEILRKSGEIEDTLDESSYGTSRVRESSGISAGAEQSMQYVNQDKKIVSCNCNAMSRQLLHSPKKFQAVTENPCSSRCAMDHAVKKRISSRAAHFISDQNVRSRGNVWDRLGKPCEHDTTVRDEKNDVCTIPIIQRKILEHGGEKLDPGMLSVPGSRLSRQLKADIPVLHSSHGNMSMTNSDERRTQERGVNIRLLHDASNVRRKRHFAEISPGPGSGSASLVDIKDRNLQEKKRKEDSQRTSVANHAQSLKHIKYEIRKLDGQDKCFRSDVAPIVGKEKAPPVDMTGEAVEAANQSLVLANCPLSAKQETVNSENNVNSSLIPVQAQVLDMKLKLRQIEMEMSKLRSKHLEMNSDGKFNLLPTSGVDHHEEDVESRTVFVTNVHFAATREALALHFSKCGVVVNVIILVDPVTAQPKGSAYITFDSKESVDKAAAMSGTSFLSRSLKPSQNLSSSCDLSVLPVMRKAEAPGVTSSQLAERPSKSWFNNTNRKGILQRPYPSSHLQWRRDLIENPEHSMSAPGAASELSNTVEDNV